MTPYASNRSGHQSLNAQIRDAERQVLNRRRQVHDRAAALIQDLHELVIRPASLLLAGGTGFLVGEFTQHSPPERRDDTDEPGTVKTPPWKIVVNLMSSAFTIYAALPLAWKLKLHRQPPLPDHPSEPCLHPQGCSGAGAE